MSSADSGSVIKCNASDLISGDEQTFTLGKEKGVGLARGEEAFVWVSENPGRGRGPKGNGLTMRGELVSWGPALGRLVTATVHITERLSGGLEMEALGRIPSVAVQQLHYRINRERPRRIWGCSKPSPKLGITCSNPETDTALIRHPFVLFALEYRIEEGNEKIRVSLLHDAGQVGAEGLRSQ